MTAPFPVTSDDCSRSAALADHSARIKTLEERQVEDRADVRSLRNLIIATLLAALGGAAVQIIALLQQHKP